MNGEVASGRAGTGTGGESGGLVKKKKKACWGPGPGGSGSGAGGGAGEGQRLGGGVALGLPGAACSAQPGCRP